ncbi:MAG: polyprenyl synthetase family protein [Alphaproteobacteria bacterium]|nr:polyprenyl synthetase family protein [Alphaproteobacteria bacterium]
MNYSKRIEQALEEAVARAEAPGAPPKLAEAIRYAVFPGGARVRPHLCIAVAEATGGSAPGLVDSAAAAIELLHCASLVHDDLPCFDDADIRRGQPSVHKAYSEPLAVLAGDAMIIMAFEALARGGVAAPNRVGRLLTTISRSVGMPYGITAGQAWESEDHADLAEYHRAKTGSLFVAATTAGAQAAGADPHPWKALGDTLGEAYQVADDIRDVTSTEEELGKPLNQDSNLGRPSVVQEFGLDGAILKLEGLLTDAIDSIPSCEGRRGLQDLVRVQAKRLMPQCGARDRVMAHSV